MKTFPTVSDVNNLIKEQEEEKMLSLEIQYKRNDEFTTVTFSNYKKIKYNFNKVTGTLEARLIGATVEKKIEYTNVISVKLMKSK